MLGLKSAKFENASPVLVDPALVLLLDALKGSEPPWNGSEPPNGSLESLGLGSLGLFFGAGGRGGGGAFFCLGGKAGAGDFLLPNKPPLPDILSFDVGGTKGSAPKGSPPGA